MLRIGEFGCVHPPGFAVAFKERTGLSGLLEFWSGKDVEITGHLVNPFRFPLLEVSMTESPKLETISNPHFQREGSVVQASPSVSRTRRVELPSQLLLHLRIRMAGGDRYSLIRSSRRMRASADPVTPMVHHCTTTSENDSRAFLTPSLDPKLCHRLPSI